MEGTPEKRLAKNVLIEELSEIVDDICKYKG